MAGEPEAIAPEVEAPAPAAPIEPAAEESVNLDDLAPVAQETDETDGGAKPQAAPVEDELEEFEWNGKPIKGPKGLKDGVLMHADYTKKTQEASARQKELDARETRLAEQAKASEDDFKLRVEHHTLTSELEQYQNVDWNAWWSQDPVEAGKGQARVQQLQWQLQNVAQQVDKRAQQRTQEAQQDFAKRLEQTREYARKEIKGWTPDLDTKIGDFSRSVLGVTDEQMQANMGPQLYRVLHLAYFGHQALNKPVVPKVPTASPAPLTVVAAKANPPAPNDPATMSMEQYAAWRAKGGGNRRSG